MLNGMSAWQRLQLLEQFGRNVMSGNKRLVRLYSRYNKNSLTDLIAITMANIEDALLEGGAIPAVDYNHLDLLREAGPLVLSMFNSNRADPIVLTCKWPDHEVTGD